MSNILGAGSYTATASSLMINSCNTGCGMCVAAHDCATLCSMVNALGSMETPKKFSAGIAMRSKICEKIGSVYDFPFNVCVMTTVPTALDIVEASTRSTTGTSYEFNIMRTVDFIGRNYLMVSLPTIDCSEIKDNNSASPSDLRHYYLGAWHRDLVPRIISSLSFYSRANSHILFEYSGYDIYLFNLLFGNAQKEINDVMAGEDSFELCYDPYYVNGAALGLASFKNINTFEGSVVPQSGVNVNELMSGSLIIDTCMDKKQFREFYRLGVWFEPPTTKNVSSRHSIHSRRVIHKSKTLWIPLDILPFGYSVASAIPVGAIHGEIGYIRLDLHQNWLDRAFYLTRFSDIPNATPLLNHKHYKSGDRKFNGEPIRESEVDWVNVESTLLSGDDATVEINADGKPKTAGAINESVFNNANTIIAGLATTDSTERGAVRTALAAQNGEVEDTGVYNSFAYGARPKFQRKDIPDPYGEEIYIWPVSKISPAYYDHIKNQISVRLFQVGYKTLDCLRDLINKLPTIFLCTEWSDTSVSPSGRSQIEVLNDLYNECVALWFIPEDSNGIESMRMYPHHYIDHELDVIDRVRMSNENGQAVSVYSWGMLNTVVPSILNLQNKLPENIGIIPFAPKLVANSFPHAFYDTNLNGQLRFTFLPFEEESAIGNKNITVNMKRGRVLITSIGINGLANANLNLFRLVY